MDLSRKNILMIIPNLDFGGAQKSFNSLANALNKNHNVHVCVFNTLEGVAYSFMPTVLDLQIPGGGNLLSKGYYFYKRCRAIRKLKIELKIDTTISYLEGANYLNVLTKSKDRVVLSVRGSKYHDHNLRGIGGALRKKIIIPVLYKYANQIVALNYGIRSELINKLGIADFIVCVIRNFYDVPTIEDYAQQPLHEKYAQLLNQNYIIYAGRLAPEKGIKPIIDTFQLLTNSNPNLKLVLVGDGPIRNELITYAQSNSLSVYTENLNSTKGVNSEQVVFLGYQNNPYKFIKHATILIIGSTTEGGPNILRESMICETLVVSTDCPYGPKEQLAPNSKPHTLNQAFIGEYGVLLPMIEEAKYKQTIKEWACIIQAQLQDSNTREAIVSKAKTWALEQSPEKVIELWERII